MKAIIIGAGHAGLSAGHHLNKAGWDVTALEASDRVGGRAGSRKMGDYLVELGATQMSTGYKAYLELAKDVGLSDQLHFPANKIILIRDGQQYVIDSSRPVSAAFSGVLTLKSKLVMIKAIRDYLAIKPPINVLDVSETHHIDDGTSIAEYCEKRLNREIYDVLVDPLIRTYTLNDGHAVSQLEWFSALKNLSGEKFVSLKGGNQSLPEKVASQFDVRLNSPVQNVKRIKGGVEVTYTAANGETETLRADACVMATQLHQTVEMAPELTDAVAPLSQKLKYNRSNLVHLGFSKKANTDAIGVLTAKIEEPHIGLVWLEHNKVPDAAPEGHSLLTIYFDESGMDAVQPDTDEEFINIALAYAHRLFPELEGTLDMSAVTRWSHAIPNTAPGIYRAIHEMKQNLNPKDSIQIAGDYLTCTGQNSAIHWGKVAANNINEHIGRKNSVPSRMAEN